MFKYTYQNALIIQDEQCANNYETEDNEDKMMILRPIPVVR